ncbi:NAD(P)-binding protein [Pelagibacterales bacterium SAG-MED13]|nr:NAD(P)-binding protein [Pelagibacterales bacterium SAG-MED13]|tara:strand:- start:202 stop:1170 length:969 start_codon:yes stop_codon:yes gene_type:complete
MNDYCVIGSGISGATIANLLNKKYRVNLYDKGRGPGGRSSFKRIKGRVGFDHGTQYFSPKTIKFKKFTNSLIKKKILKKWKGNHIFLNSKIKENKKHVKLIGNNGNNDICKYLLKKIKCYYNNEVKKIYYKKKQWSLLFSDGRVEFYKGIILTCPFPQLKKLSAKYINSTFIKKKLEMDANITVLIAIKKNKKSPSSFLFDDPILGWAGNENSKNRFKSKYDLWTLQSTFKWANKNIDRNKQNLKKNSKILIEKFFKLTKIKRAKVFYSINHGWKYSSNSKPLKIKSYWDPSKKIGVCADWFIGPRLESGWISAHDLFKKII